MTVGIISHYLCMKHNVGENHPESPARLSAIQDQLISSGLDPVVRQFDTQPIDEKLLELVHTKEYIESIKLQSPTQGITQLDPDTAMMPATLKAAMLAAGATIQAVDLVMNKTLTAAFCATRPPGHHAERDKAMGFCIFNNIALAAQYALTHFDLNKVAIIDFDVHHGNGTEDIFAGNSQILFCSSFQHPFYPYRNEAKDTAKNIINAPLKAGSGSKEFKQIVTDCWLPALESFKPEMVLVSAGFDAHIEDSISQINLLDSDYLWVTNQLKLIADKYANGRIVSTLEGGYSLSALGRSVVAHINGLIGNN